MAKERIAGQLGEHGLLGGGMMLPKDSTKEVEMPVVDEDKLVGFIMRQAYQDRKMNLMYEDVRAILDYELEFLKGEGIAE